MIPVEGHRGLYRDDNSNAIINCNDSDYNDYIYLKTKMTIEKKQINDLKVEIEDLKSLLEKVLKNKI